MKVPLEPPMPTETDKLWELYWAVKKFLDPDDPNEPSEYRSAKGTVEDILDWLTNWLYENSDESTPRNEGEQE